MFENLCDSVLVFSIFSFLCLSCGPVQNLDKLLALKRMDKNQQGARVLIERQTKGFQILKEDVRQGSVAAGLSQAQVLKKYAEPVFARKIDPAQESAVEVWLYREPRKFFHNEKVYLYFDQSGSLVRTVHQEGENGKSQQETSAQN